MAIKDKNYINNLISAKKTNIKLQELLKIR